MKLLLLPTNGFGNHVLNKSLRSFSGHSSETDLIPETCLQERTFLQEGLIVCSPRIATMSVLCTYFSDVIFCQTFWWKLNFEWNTDLSIIDMLMDCRSRYNLKRFKEVIIIGCWAMWNHRNKNIFENQSIGQTECFRIFKQDFHLMMHRAKPSLKEGMQQWLNTM
jgi:hypothetical protein